MAVHVNRHDNVAASRKLDIVAGLHLAVIPPAVADDNNGCLVLWGDRVRLVHQRTDHLTRRGLPSHVLDGYGATCSLHY